MEKCMCCFVGHHLLVVVVVVVVAVVVVGRRNTTEKRYTLSHLVSNSKLPHPEVFRGTEAPRCLHHPVSYDL